MKKRYTERRKIRRRSDPKWVKNINNLLLKTSTRRIITVLTLCLLVIGLGTGIYFLIKRIDEIRNDDDKNNSDLVTIIVFSMLASYLIYITLVIIYLIFTVSFRNNNKII